MSMIDVYGGEVTQPTNEDMQDMYEAYVNDAVKLLERAEHGAVADYHYGKVGVRNVVAEMNAFRECEYASRKGMPLEGKISKEMLLKYADVVASHGATLYSDKTGNDRRSTYANIRLAAKDLIEYGISHPDSAQTMVPDSWSRVQATANEYFDGFTQPLTFSSIEPEWNIKDITTDNVLELQLLQTLNNEKNMFGVKKARDIADAFRDSFFEKKSIADIDVAAMREYGPSDVLQAENINSADGIPAYMDNAVGMNGSADAYNTLVEHAVQDIAKEYDDDKLTYFEAIASASRFCDKNRMPGFINESMRQNLVKDFGNDYENFEMEKFTEYLADMKKRHAPVSIDYSKDADLSKSAKQTENTQVLKDAPKAVQPTIPRGSDLFHLEDEDEDDFDSSITNR